jgi:hypothetical protein
VEFVEDASGSGNRPVNPFGLRTIVARKDILLNNLNEGEQSREAHGVQHMQTQDGILGHPIYQPCHCSKQLSHQDQNHSKEIPSLFGHQEENQEEDYCWLDTYTHVKLQALEKLRKTTMKSSFSFVDFGIFGEFAASATICNEGHGFQPKVSFLDHFPLGASTYCLKVVHLLLLNSFGVTIPHKMSPLFGSFGLIPFFSVPPFGFCCYWPSIARSAKFLQTTQKQFRNAKTNCTKRIT